MQQSPAGGSSGGRPFPSTRGSPESSSPLELVREDRENGRPGTITEDAVDSFFVAAAAAATENSGDTLKTDARLILHGRALPFPTISSEVLAHRRGIRLANSLLVTSSHTSQ